MKFSDSLKDMKIFKKCIKNKMAQKMETESCRYLKYYVILESVCCHNDDNVILSKIQLSIPEFINVNNVIMIPVLARYNNNKNQSGYSMG